MCESSQATFSLPAAVGQRPSNQLLEFLLFTFMADQGFKPLT